MMQPHIRKHVYYYLFLLISQVASFIGVLLVAPNVQLQMLVVTINSIIYVIWASLHHYLHHDLHPKIVLEYILVGFLGISITFFMLRLQM